MRVRTLEIRWHDSKPINSCDFQPVPPKKARPANEKDYTAQSYRLATAGEDNNVRIWMVYPNIMPTSVVAESVNASGSTTANPNPPTPHPPRVEYLSTLAKHQAPVNVVRFSPSGELIASAGDDGMIIVWAPSAVPPGAVYGAEPDESQYEKEYWKARTPFRCSTMQVYDLAWNPTGEYVIAGSTDNTARIFNAADGKCLREIAEHSHFVQGVAWDPLNEYIATQSSDRSVHVFSTNTKHGAFDVHAVGKNVKMAVRHTRTPSASITRKRPRNNRRESAASDAESGFASDREEAPGHLPPLHAPIPLTPAPSIASTPSASAAAFLPPPSEHVASRRSSFSSVAPGSPAMSHYSNSHIGRSPSPMPPLPAIRAPPSPQLVAQARLYGDENFTNFFRRLTFSPDGGLLLTPSGHFEDPSNIAPLMGESPRGRRGHPTEPPQSSVFIYSRANFARSPIAQLPGHKKASIAVKFSPILYELRPGVVGASGGQASSSSTEHKSSSANVAVERGGKEEKADVDMVGPLPLSATVPRIDSRSPTKRNGSHSRSQSRMSGMTAPSPSPQTPHPSQTLPSPALSAIDMPAPVPVLQQQQGGVPQQLTSAPTSTSGSGSGSGSGPGSAPPPPSTGPNTVTPSSSSSSSSSQVQTGSVFALPYRMLFAVATMDTITIHDTQQAGPIALLTKLHYDEFTDMAWSPDGQCLMLTSRDGYCTIVIFDQILPAHHTQQHSLQLQSIASAHHQHHHHHHHSHSSSSAAGISTSASGSGSGSVLGQGYVYPITTSATQSVVGTPAPTPAKRSAPLPSPVAERPPSESVLLPPPVPLSASSSTLSATAIDAKSSSSNSADSVAAGLATTGSGESSEATSVPPTMEPLAEPPKKKRRVALTRIGDVD